MMNVITNEASSMTPFANHDVISQHPSMVEPPNISELDSICESLYGRLASHGSQGGKLIDQIITLLENFKFQVDKQKKLGYCDYGMAYVSFKVGLSLFNSSVNALQPKFKGFSDQICDAFEDQREHYEDLRRCIKKLNASNLGDPLMNRLAKLKVDVKEDELTKYKYLDSISVQSLNGMIRNASKKILLIDFRSKKEFTYSHINFLNIVNVEPSLIRSLWEKNAKATDSDLEDLLKNLLDPVMFKLFCDRYKFDLIVIYNLRFGGTASDRFLSMEQLLVNGDKNGFPYASPFLKFIDLIMFRTKYLSSTLRQYPVYLSGGMQRWYQVYGEGSLTNASIGNSPQKSPASKLVSLLRSNTSEEPGTLNASIYLRNFNEYLTSANTRSREYVIPSSQTERTYSRMDPVTINLKNELSSIKPMALNPKSPVSIDREGNRPQRQTIILPESQSKKESQEKLLKLFATGLTNLGNSCYMNCIIQSLAATPQLTGFFFLNSEDSSGSSGADYKRHININNTLGTKGVITSNFVELLSSMISNKGKYFSPKLFKQIMGSLSPGQQFANSDQQDCVEFLNYILDSLHEDLNQRAAKSPEERASIMELSPQQEKAREFLPIRLASTIEWERYLKLNFSVIVDYFQGQYLSQLKCLVCGLTSTTYNTFSVLSLPIPTSPERSSGNFLLSQCLDKFTETELLDDGNKWHCPRCKAFTRLTKKISITRLPSAIIIHFKRFGYESTGKFKKLDTFIKYPVDDILDLTPYWPQVGTYAKDDQSDRISVEKEQELLATMPVRNQKPPFRYRLYSVVNHFGNLTTGHYTSYVRKEVDGVNKSRWCYFDDAKVTYGCDKSVVLNKNAYCLFYQRV